MHTDQEIREFLTTRRARLTPQQAGLPTFGRTRRVQGLRREEVALLAGISVEYYTRLERGNACGVSDDVVDSVSAGLQLDEAEHAHLLDLVRAANTERPSRRIPTPTQVRPSVRRIIDAMEDLPSFVGNGRLDVLYANVLFEALHSELYREATRPVNTGRFMFLDPRAREFYVDWETNAKDIVAALHGEAGRNPYDRGPSDLVGLLSTRSEEFRTWWARHDVRFHRSGVKRFRHPLVGELTLAYERLELPADAGLAIVTYSAERGSESEQRLAELARWAATRSRLAPTVNAATADP